MGAAKRPTMSAAKAEPTMKVGPDVPTDTPRPLVADGTHFRDLGNGSVVLYHSGAHVPAEHADLPVLGADLVDGVWVVA